MKSKTRFYRWLSGLLLSISLCNSAMALPPRSISFQAYLKDSAGLPINTTENITFKLYDAAVNGTLLWEDTLSVTVTDGLLSVELGNNLNDPDNNGDQSDAVTFYSSDGNRYIGITIGNGQEMAPRHRLIPSFHAITADDAASLGGNPPAFYATQAGLDAETNSRIASDNALQSSIATSNQLPTCEFYNTCPSGYSAMGRIGEGDLINCGGDGATTNWCTLCCIK